MTEFNEIANIPIEIEIAGHKLLARRPDLNVVFGKVEAEIVSKAIGVINKAVKEFGLEGSDKVKFLSDSMQTIPKGSELQTQAQDALASVEGTTLLLRCVLKEDQPTLTDEQIMQIVMSDPEGASEWMAYLTGDRKKLPSQKEVRLKEGLAK